MWVTWKSSAPGWVTLKAQEGRKASLSALSHICMKCWGLALLQYMLEFQLTILGAAASDGWAHSPTKLSGLGSWVPDLICEWSQPETLRVPLIGGCKSGQNRPCNGLSHSIGWRQLRHWKSSVFLAKGSQLDGECWWSPVKPEMFFFWADPQLLKLKLAYFNEQEMSQILHIMEPICLFRLNHLVQSSFWDYATSESRWWIGCFGALPTCLSVLPGNECRKQSQVTGEAR